MRLLKQVLTSILIAAVIGGCSKKNDISPDTEYPVIDISADNAFPKQCSVIKRGENFIFRARLTDNVQLGSASIDIHHNFDHHTHSTDVQSCQFDAVKAAVNPFLLIQTYPIQEGLKNFEINQTVTVPANADPGDYHFMIRLTDKAGWQTIKGISIKIQ